MVERYLDLDTGRSTEHAEKIAGTRKALNQLQIEMQEPLPHRSTMSLPCSTAVTSENRTSINWTAAYTVQAGDTGILDILKREMPNSGLGDKKICDLAYKHLFDTVDRTYKDRSDVDNGKIFTINFIEAGDKIDLNYGRLTVRRNGSQKDKYGSFSVNILPWKEGEGETPAAEPPASSGMVQSGA